MNLGIPPFLARLAECRRILLVGAGGGFDVLSAVPLFHHLQEAGQQVFLGSLSFSELPLGPPGPTRRSFVEVGPGTPGDAAYFPEKYLSEWYALHGLRVPVYCFPSSGAQGILQVYRDLVRTLDLDALVLVDGGTDSLMRGDEPGLGSPAEDMASITAAHMLDLPVRLLLNLGFGVDTHHGVCHALVLEAVADLTAAGAFLGAFSLLPGMPEFRALAAAVEHVCGRMPGRESIVATSIVAAGEGRFGDHHPTPRTAGSTLFLNPLMAMYWGFEVDGVARRCLYLDYMRDTWNRRDVHRAIENFLYTIEPRKWVDIPL